MPPSRKKPTLAESDRIVIISPRRSDGAALREILGHRGTAVTWFATRKEGEAHIRQSPVGVVVCEKDLHDGCWRDLLRELAVLEWQPNLIVSSRVADEMLWAEVLNLGGYDVLITPFEPSEAVRVITMARRDWNHRCKKFATDRPGRIGAKPPGAERRFRAVAGSA